MVGQAMKSAERSAKAEGLFVDARLMLGLGRDLTALELALERGEAAHVGFKAASGRFTERQST
ncbi:MAG: hypothetical protein Q8P97_01670 [bacterium]|nr:hypothetical protein [bacterium]